MQRHVPTLQRLAKQSVASGFSFVESFGLLYAAQLVRDSLGSSRPSSGMNGESSATLEISISPDEQTNAAKTILKNIGLRRPFAPLVILCGHRSFSTNNPLASSLDCGACGGHSGEVNARVAATILNDPTVRTALAQTDFSIPDDTVFIAGVHETTTDRVLLFPTNLQNEHSTLLLQVRNWMNAAGSHVRRERLPALSHRDSLPIRS